MRYELKPCPFCGGNPIDGTGKYPSKNVIWCSNQPVNCGNRSMYTVEQWNTRNLEPKQQLADEMFDMLEHLLNVENLWHDYKSIEDLISRSRGEHHEISTNSQQED